MQLGKHRLSYVYDGRAQINARAWFPEAGHDWPEEYFHGSVGALLIEHGDSAMLIDAGLGPVEHTDWKYGVLTGGELLTSLNALGREPEELELIALTHLHLDHIGWVPGIPLSRVLVSKKDVEAHPEKVAGFEHRYEYVAEGEQVFPGVKAVSSAGHTPGHVSYVITAGGHRVIAFGDIMHAPIQIAHPEWATAPDMDPAAAVATRRALIEELSKPDTIGFGVHFTEPFGRVVDGEWAPIAQ
ncbi:MBL fold metallo-hydrolase [Pseudonocardiaceae bacterium YIM PH 21723]|nr:MBL fold metallo-hydrolase [Pseudonocardiaceae bacterium YIM PH 21723]